jgi:hypothetical protein
LETPEGFELLATGHHNAAEVVTILKCDPSHISRGDIAYLRSEAREKVKHLLDVELPSEFMQILTDVSLVTRTAYGLLKIM